MKCKAVLSRILNAPPIAASVPVRLPLWRLSMEGLGNRLIFKKGVGILEPVQSFLGRLWVLIMVLVLIIFYLFWPLLHPSDYIIDMILGGSAP